MNEGAEEGNANGSIWSVDTWITRSTRNIDRFVHSVCDCKCVRHGCAGRSTGTTSVNENVDRLVGRCFDIDIRQSALFASISHHHGHHTRDSYAHPFSLLLVPLPMVPG
jgi:hypothetical protein